MSGICNKKVLELIYDSIDEYNKEVSVELQLKKTTDSALFGEGSVLDSLGLINLIVAVEQNIEDKFDVIITLADERAMSQETSPFRTGGTLTDYIEMLLGEKLND